LEDDRRDYHNENEENDEKNSEEVDSAATGSGTQQVSGDTVRRQLAIPTSITDLRLSASVGRIHQLEDELRKLDADREHWRSLAKQVSLTSHLPLSFLTLEWHSFESLVQTNLSSEGLFFNLTFKSNWTRRRFFLLLPSELSIAYSPSPNLALLYNALFLSLPFSLTHLISLACFLAHLHFDYLLNI